MEDEKNVITTEAVQYTLLPGEKVLLELKVKEFGDDGSEEILVTDKSKNPLASLNFSAFLNSLIFGRSKNLPIFGNVKSGLFVVTNLRCFLAKSSIDAAQQKKKSPFILLLVLGIIALVVGIVMIKTRIGILLLIVGTFLGVFAFMTKNKKTADLRAEEHEFVSFPRKVLTEYNSFTCKKDAFAAGKTGCCRSDTKAIIYKTVLTVGLNTTKGEPSTNEPVKVLELVLDPTQVSNHEQALAVISKLTELAQQA